LKKGLTRAQKEKYVKDDILKYVKENPSEKPEFIIMSWVTNEIVTLYEEIEKVNKGIVKAVKALERFEKLFQELKNEKKN
jgi:hypothetical protein